MNTAPEVFYQLEKDKHAAELALLQRKHNQLGWLRLGLIVATAIGSYQVFTMAGIWALAAAALGIGFFLWVVSIDADNNRRIRLLKQLVQLNEEELRVMEGQYVHRFDGAGFLLHEHPYANDLDLLGPHSLYQMLNRCSGEQGRELLAANLLAPLLPAQVVLRQEAAAELAGMPGWQQQLQAHAAATQITKATEARLSRWLAQPDETFTAAAWKWIVPLYTVIACGVAGAAIFELISGSVFSLCFLLFIIVSFVLGRRATPTSMQLSGIVAEMETLAEVLDCMESPAFNSARLQQLQAAIRAGNTKASHQIRELKDVLNRFDLRLNVFLFLFLNSFLLWDVRQLMALNRWRTRNRAAAANWFASVAEMEVLSSLATLRFNNSEWATPTFQDQHFAFAASGLGHPLLLREKVVRSDFELYGRGKVALVTGSNMAGKSTFLRSIGVNVVLAQIGAVVCAHSLSLSPVELLSSMRIADNLAESTSTFYAELKKLKTIIEAVNAHRPVLVLLDEILRGTNSLDRHTGSEALIRQMLREQSVAVLATHDVELARLEAAHPNGIENYHFDVQVAGQELYFDYKLKHGVCTTLNASVLMRKIGIELD